MRCCCAMLCACDLAPLPRGPCQSQKGLRLHHGVIGFYPVISCDCPRSPSRRTSASCRHGAWMNQLQTSGQPTGAASVHCDRTACSLLGSIILFRLTPLPRLTLPSVLATYMPDAWNRYLQHRTQTLP